MSTIIIGERSERFYRLDLKKGNSRRGKLAIDTLDSSMMKKTAADSKAKGKKPGSHAACLVNSCQGKEAKSFIPTKLFNSSTHWHWM